MRLQSGKQVTVRGKTIGGPDVLVCLPLAARHEKEIFSQAANLRRRYPDLFEWRIDGYGELGNTHKCLETLAGLRKAIGDIPLIFTCRVPAEGGFGNINRAERFELILSVIKSGLADIIDVEISNETAFLDAVKKAAIANGVKLILSHHNFKKTPDEAVIIEKLMEAEALGADISKVAVMPKNHGDVLTLLSATLKARKEKVSIPMITISMGDAGRISRLAGGLFGSDVTFAVGEQASAPGQIPIRDLRNVMNVLYS